MSFCYLKKNNYRNFMNMGNGNKNNDSSRRKSIKDAF